MIPWWQLEFAALVLERGKVGSITIRELVSASGLSRQTVQRYLRDFEQAGLVVRSRVVEGRGRPKHHYKPTMKLARAVSTGLGGELDKVLISFKILRRACKWCKGGFCKKKVKKMHPHNLSNNQSFKRNNVKYCKIKNIKAQFSNGLARGAKPLHQAV